MPFLLIDTATSIPVLSTSDAPNRNDWMPAEGDVATRILSGLDRLFCAVQSASISGIVVGHGPGSYTGLRIGLSVAKTWGYAHRLPVCGVSSLAILMPSQKGIDALISRQVTRPAMLFDARGGGFYAALGLKECRDGMWNFSWQAPQIISMADLAEFSLRCDAALYMDGSPIAERWELAGGAKVLWQKVQPNGLGLWRAAHEGGNWRAWSSLYEDVRPNYLRAAVG